MEDMWTKEGRVKPTALDYDAIMADSFPTPPLRHAPHADAGSTSTADQDTSNTAVAASSINATLRDQRELSLKETLVLFVDRFVKCEPIES
jgi:ubiquitin-like 1-activating enzyme E1 B